MRKIVPAASAPVLAAAREDVGFVRKPVGIEGGPARELEGRQLDLDPALVERALPDRRPDQEAAVTKALQEFIARREQRQLLELFGKLEWDPGYDYKRERSRD